MNHSEYNNSVRDLLGTQQTPADQFTTDPIVNGFDNNADALNIGANDMQLYESAAEALAAEAANPNNAKYASLVPCAKTGGATCLQQFVQTFGLSAWRRPLTNDEISAVVQTAQSASTTDLPSQVGTAITTLLTSPYFIYRVELDANPNVATPHALSGYELAARLSYFLWSSTPDATLLAAAGDGSILTDAGISQQVTRMLADPRSSALSQNFAGQWWELRQTQTLAPDPNMFPEWNATLEADMVAESQHFFADMLNGNTTLPQMFTADYTYINDDLAAFYGLPAVNSNTLTRVTLPQDGQRHGILGQAAVLAATSFPIRTSPVRRGEFLLGQLLCSPPPPPPANVPQLPGPSTNAPTQRQQLEAHASNAACAACHNEMDPYGFALESFDAIGSSRTMDNGAAINTATTLPTGQAVGGPAELAAALAADPRVPTCAVQMFYVYALGRSVVSTDAAPLKTLGTNFMAQGQHLNQLVEQIALSDTFRMRRGGN